MIMPLICGAVKNRQSCIFLIWGLLWVLFWPNIMVLHILPTGLYHEMLKYETFFQNSGNYLKNHCTNTRLVCTRFNYLFMLNPNMAVTTWVFKIFEKKKLNTLVNYLRSTSVCSRKMIMVITVIHTSYRHILNMKYSNVLYLWMLTYNILAF